MQPGHLFIWTAPMAPVILYSRVLETPGPIVQAGYRRTHTFGGPLPLGGRTIYVSEHTAVMLLSLEQMLLAGRRGWPQDEEGLSEIFLVPSS